MPASGLAIFQWNYTDAENNAETQYEMQISADSGFNNIVSDSGIINGTANEFPVFIYLASTSPTSSCAPNCPYINYNVNYYWRVKVWGIITGTTTTQDSGWIYYGGTCAKGTCAGTVSLNSAV
jgi:hypothetical protein